MSVYDLAETSLPILSETYHIERDDPSLNMQGQAALTQEYPVAKETVDRLFLTEYHLEYVSDYFQRQQQPLRIISYPRATNTCYEKAQILDGWDPLRVIKAFYLESSADHALYAVVVPETGCFLDKTYLKTLLSLPDDAFFIKAKNIPRNMDYGTCSPFITEEDIFGNRGRVKHIIFDTETLVLKRHENTLDDFSFGLNHRFSIQMNYYHCFRMLQQRFRNVVIDQELLTLSLKEHFVRKKGQIKINYEFKSLNYRTAKFINSIHGYGDVSIVNDSIDELDLPDILTTPVNS